jgi:hypothetical protein
MPEAPGWELRLPMQSAGLSFGDLEHARMVTLYSSEKKKTYEFGWVVSNGTFAEYLVPLWIKNSSGIASLRLYSFDRGSLRNGLPSPDGPAPEGMFIEDFDVFFRYGIDSAEDQDYPGIGLWKLTSCER